MIRSLAALLPILVLALPLPAAASAPPEVTRRLERLSGDGPGKAMAEHRHAVAKRMAAGDSWAPDLGPSPVDVQHYELSLSLDFNRQIASGAVRLDFTAATDGLATLELDASLGLEIHGVVQISDGGRVFDSPRQVTHRHLEDRLSVDLVRPLAAGQRAEVLVTYSGRASQGGQGINWQSHGPGDRIAWTMAEPFGARLWWPCNDRPDDKAVVSLRVTAPEQYTVASNGLEVSRTSHGDGTATTHWASQYPVAPYLVVMNVSNFVVSQTTYTADDGTTMPVVLYAYPEVADQAEQDLAVTSQMIGVLAEHYGEYPFLGEKYGNCTANFGGGMEHQTLTTLGYSAVGTAWMEYLNVHELGHQWWGDWITCADWRELWLNEGFATLTEWLWAEHRGEAVLQDYLRDTDSLGFFFGPVYDNPVPFSSTVYDKAGWVLRMMRHLIGDEAFFDAVHAYRQAHAGEAATSWDLLSAFEETAGEELDWFFDQWVFGENRPRVAYEWEAVSETELSLRFTQTQTNAAPFRMPLDVRITTASGVQDERVWLEGASTEVTLTTTQAAVNVELDPDNWVLVDLLPGDVPAADLGPDFPGPFDAGLVRQGTSATLEIPLTNVGGSRLTVSAADMYYQNAGFQLASPTDFPVNLAPGETRVFEVAYNPSGIGEDTDWLWLETDMPLRDGFLLAQVTGHGALVEGAQFQASSSVNFGSVPLGGLVQEQLDILNMGDVGTELALAVDGAAFSLASPATSVVHPGSWGEVRLHFHPMDAGEHEGTLTIETNSATTPVATVALSGVATDAGRATVTPPVLTFAMDGLDHELAVTVANTGTTELTLLDLTISGPFQATAQTPATIPPGGSANVTVGCTLSKSSPQEARGLLRILTSDEASPWTVVPLFAVEHTGSADQLWTEIVPAVAAAPGLGGATWKSDLVVVNPTAVDHGVTLTLLNDGSAEGADGAVTIRARSQRRIADVVGHLSSSGVAGLRLTGSASQLVAHSRTFAETPGATYGQGIPPVAGDALQHAGDRWLLAGLSSGAGFHTNVGVVNPGQIAATATVTVHDSNGGVLGSFDLQVPPGQFRQNVDALAPLEQGGLSGAFATLDLSPEDAVVAAYASVVDDTSHDPTYVTPLAMSTPSKRLIVPAVASNPGLNQTRWSSALSLVNTTADDLTASLRLYREGGSSVETVTVPAGGAWSTGDVVRDLFGLQGTGWVAVETAAPALFAASRIRNTTDAGTYGQGVPAVEEEAATRAGQVAVVPGLAGAPAFRTNLGLTSLAEVAVEVSITVYSDSGEVLDERILELAPMTFTQVTDLLAGLPASSGWAEVVSEDPDAHFVVHGSVVDNATGDPAWVEAFAREPR